ncbi:hypothetical protein [Bifidobacterium xylocopae]|uniref:hypothetical protein n=1 Tax=Bifidobacterium xylocopae TaxID=2493119 RepID=UPI001374A3C3|nr:hypothetical protein [Bifidobacterium xylocopae]
MDGPPEAGQTVKLDVSNSPDGLCWEGWPGFDRSRREGTGMAVTKNPKGSRAHGERR